MFCTSAATNIEEEDEAAKIKKTKIKHSFFIVLFYIITIFSPLLQDQSANINMTNFAKLSAKPIAS
jgi:hypothetical protein